MKGMWKKSIGLMLSLVMLLSLCTPLALAAESENVFFEADMESYVVGGKPPSGKGGFDAMTIKETACLFVEKDADGNTVLRGYHGDVNEPGAKARSPRVEKFVYTQGLTHLKISYDMRFSGQSYTSLYLRDLETNTILGSILFRDLDTKGWHHAEVEVNLKSGAVNVFIDGKATDSTSVDLAGVSCMAVRFSVTAELDGSHVLLDNIKLSTTDKDYKNVAPKVDDPLPTSPYNAADEKPESGDVETILDVDFEDATIGRAANVDAKGGFTGRVSNDAARMFVEADSDGSNRMLRAYHGAPNAEGATARSPRVERTVMLEGLKTLTIDYDVKSNLGSSKQTLQFVHPTENTAYITLKVPYNFQNWTHIKVRCDMVGGKATVYVAGRLQETYDLPAMTENAFRVRWNTSVVPEASWIALDNVRITTPDKDAGGLFGVSGTTVNWKLLQMDETEKPP